MKWARTAFGATFGSDFRLRASPTPDSTMAQHLLSGFRDKTSLSRSEIDEGRAIIAFDGSRWFAGYAALSPPTFNRDSAGRRLHFIHGYTSSSMPFPQEIPVVDCHRFNELYDVHIAPFWSERYTPRQQTCFEFPGSVPISEFLPSTLLLKLQDAHRRHEVFALHLDLVTKQWGEIGGFVQAIEQETSISRKSVVHNVATTLGRAQSVRSSVCLTQPTTSNCATKAVGQMHRKHLPWLGASAVLVGGLVGLTLFRAQDYSDKRKQGLSRQH